MCGICGDVDLSGPPDAEGVRRAARALAHRGPDAEGFFTEGPAALGHRRLSILDLESGQQPMERDGVSITFNGEAYDFAELREDLQKRGHPFTTRSDTEVVLRAYLQWGEEFAERVHGMFALAIWDSRFRKLILARDRLGKKPLYYFVRNSRCIFGSELKALLAHGGKACCGVDCRFEMLLSAKEHEMHHRGQLMTMQRMNGIVPHVTRAAQERMARMTAAATAQP